MLRLIDRYVMREVLGAFLGVGAILFFITLGSSLVLTLERISRGKVPAVLLMSQIGLRSVDAFPLLLPLAIFLAVLLAFGRMSRDSEMTVIFASGVGLGRLVRPVLAIVLPLLGLLLAVAFWWSPMALRLSDDMIDRANRSLLVVGMEAQRFVELPDGSGVIYVSKMSDDGTRFENLFVQQESEGRMDITTAAAGKLYQDPVNGARFLSLQDGYRLEGRPEHSDWRTMQFKQNDIQLPEIGKNADRAMEKRADLGSLLRSVEPIDRAQLHWRIGLCLSAVLLALIAMPLAQSKPRDPRHGKVMLALFFYLTYFSLLSAGSGWIAQGIIPPLLGLWWAHVAMLVLSITLIRSSNMAS